MLLHTFLCFTLLLQIRTEWVEIPQQPYKPTRTTVKHHSPAVTEAIERTTKRNVIYTDNPVRHQWSTRTTVKHHSPVITEAIERTTKRNVIYTDNPVRHQWNTTIEQEATTKRNRIYVNNFKNQHPSNVVGRPTTATVEVEANVKRNKNNAAKLNLDTVTKKATVEAVNLETSTKGIRIYPNVTLNKQWIKGNVFRVPASVAKVEHIKKHDTNVEHKKILTKENESVEENYVRNVNRRIDHFNTVRYPIEETSIGKEITIASTPKNYRLTKAPVRTNENTELTRYKNSLHKVINVSLKPIEDDTSNRIKENSGTRTPGKEVIFVPEPTKHLNTTEILKDKFQTNRPNRRIYIQDIIKHNKDQNHDAEILPVFKPKVEKPIETTNTNRINNVSINKYTTRKPDADFETKVVKPLIPGPSNDKVDLSSRFKPKDKHTYYIVRIDKPYLKTPQVDLNHVSEKPPTTASKDIEDHTEAIPVQRIDISSLTLPKNPEFVTKQEHIDDEDDAKKNFEDYEEAINNSNPITEQSVSATTKPPERTTKATKNQNKDDTKEEIAESIELNESIPSIAESEDLKTSEKKPNPIENVVKFMKVISETISKSTHKSIESKTRYLQRLRDTIMMNIEERIDGAWPDDDAEGTGKRATRAARGHVEFPSSEGALMTISFLTFAVFLIKLVLQVINTYKNKTMMVSPAVFAVSRAALARRSNTHN